MMTMTTMTTMTTMMTTTTRHDDDVAVVVVTTMTATTRACPRQLRSRGRGLARRMGAAPSTPRTVASAPRRVRFAGDHDAVPHDQPGDRRAHPQGWFQGWQRWLV